MSDSHHPGALAANQLKLADDPWSLERDQRLELEAALAGSQAHWQPRLAALLEPPRLAPTFPAFLLATTPFRHLADGIGQARRPGELDTGTADQLQRFVDRYRDYLLETDAAAPTAAGDLERDVLLAARDRHPVLPAILQPRR
jgi:hypothetical protein